LIALVKESQKFVTGEVSLELYKGGVTVTGRRSPFSLYNSLIASMDFDLGAYNQADATGFINFQSIPIRRNAMRAGKI
jgi:argininosuccinate synthase